MSDWIRESNLIEEVDDPAEDTRSWQAWEWLQKQPWNLETVLLLHKRIMRKLNPRIAGKIRTCNVYVGNYMAPEWTVVSGLLAEWVRDSETCNGKPDCPSSEEEIRLAHVEFESIHPFEDGNGRTGRMMMNWQRVRAGLEPLVILASERWDYYDWFKNQRNP